MATDSTYIPKWHRELELFSQIKPYIILDGNVLDVYQYPIEGTTPKGSIVRLPEYLYYFFKDIGYKSVMFFDSTVGFYNSIETDMASKAAPPCCSSRSTPRIRAPPTPC